MKVLEFEPPIFGVVCNRSANCATAQKVSAGIKEAYLRLGMLAVGPVLFGWIKAQDAGLDCSKPQRGSRH